MKQISDWNEYQEIYQIVSDAEETLISGGEAGKHYELSWILRGYGIYATGREDSVKQGYKLLKQYEHNFTQSHSIDM